MELEKKLQFWGEGIVYSCTLLALIQAGIGLQEIIPDLGNILFSISVGTLVIIFILEITAVDGSNLDFSWISQNVITTKWGSLLGNLIERVHVTQKARIKKAPRLIGVLGISIFAAMLKTLIFLVMVIILLILLPLLFVFIIPWRAIETIAKAGIFISMLFKKRELAEE